MPEDDPNLRFRRGQGKDASVGDELRSGAPDAPRPGQDRVDYPPTLWTLVLEAAGPDDVKAREAMGRLCEHYRHAMLGYFRLKCGDSHAAEDLTGAFMEHLLERNRLRHFEKRENLRFRNYLGRALKFYFLDHRPELAAEPVNEGQDAAGPEPELAKQLDGQIALAAHLRAVSALRDSYARLGKEQRLERLQRFLFEDADDEDYPRAAKDLGISVNTLHQAVYRLRHDYYERFRAEVAPTVRHVKEELDEETRYLIGLLPAALPTVRRS